MSTRRPQWLDRGCLPVCFVLLIGCGGSLAAEAAPARGSVRGCVELAGHGAYRGVASLWPAAAGKSPDPRRAIRPPLVSAPLGPDGCFTLQAAPGEYFVGTVVRATEGGWQGPPRPGDMVFLSPDADGKSLRATVSTGETVDIGRHARGWRYAGFDASGASPTITGTLTGTDGKPVPGLLVFAFTDSSMSSDPLAVSDPSDSQGRYLLRLPEPATVYLRAREHYGRKSPADGGPMGIYSEGGTPLAVSVDSQGDKTERNLTIFLIPPLDKRRKEGAGQPTGQKNY